MLALRPRASGSYDDSQGLPTVQALTAVRPRSLEQWERAHADQFPAERKERRRLDAKPFDQQTGLLWSGRKEQHWR